MNPPWEKAWARVFAAAARLAGAYTTGGDREPALRDFQRAAFDLAALEAGIDPDAVPIGLDAEPFDLERSRQLDRELVAREART